MAKGYHILIVSEENRSARSWRISALSLRLFVIAFLVMVPLLILSVVTTIHYQKKITALRRMQDENVRLVENRDMMTAKLAKLEKNVTLMDDSIQRLGDLMDIDPQSLTFGTGPIDDFSIDLSSDDYGNLALDMAEEANLVGEWVDENGPLTVNRFNNKVARLIDESGLLSKKLEEIYAQNRERISFVNASPDVLPVQGWVTSEFGMRKHPLAHNVKMHNGIDIASPVGTKVEAPASGRVVFAGRGGGYGNMAVVQHGYGVTTVYAHMSRVSVKTGQVLAKGDVVGEVGNTGSSTGPHLHYEVQIDGIPYDPVKFVSK